jgi:sensor histidine kinase YesM
MNSAFKKIINLPRAKFMSMAIQLTVWLFILFLPSLVMLMSTQSLEKALTLLHNSYPAMLWMMLLYFINYFVLVPHVLFKHGVWKFILVNVVVFSILSCMNYFDLKAHFDTKPLQAYLMAITFSLFGYTILSVCAVGVNYIERWNAMQQKLKEEKQKNAEAELTWLKSQLNPHFLFNTLNNISSLMQIDADAAQESIGQLSDLMRYSLYESNAAEVPIEGELEFMHNYIGLMRLRCNDLTKVDVDLQQPSVSFNIAPLLFISLIENAFKHGVNSRKPSWVKISMTMDAGNLVFTVENSLFPKPATDRIGSGIGIENTLRRLHLAYEGRYEYVNEARGDRYFTQITIKNCL